MGEIEKDTVNPGISVELEEALRRARQEGVVIREDRGLHVFSGLGSCSPEAEPEPSTVMIFWQPSANRSLEDYRARSTTVLDDKLFTHIGLSLEASCALLVELAHLHHMKLVPRED